MREVVGVRRVQDLRLLVEHLDDLVQRGDRGEERVVELRELLHGVEEVGEVEHEGEERADREVVPEVAVAAVAEHDRGRRGGQEVDEREVEAVGHDRDVVRLAVMGVDLPEVALVCGLAVERLHDPHAGDVLGEGCRDEAEPFADRPVGARGDDAEKRRRDRHEREDREGGERELPVEGEEDRGRADENQRVLEEARDAVGDELVERLDIVREAADQHSGPVALVEAEREPLQVAEELVAQVGEDALPGPAREIGLRAAHDPVERAGHDEDDDDLDEPPVVVGPDPVVEGELREVGRRERRERRCEERDDRKRRAQLVAGREPGEGRDAVRGAPPRPVLDFGSALHREVGAGLPDPHAVRLQPCGQLAVDQAVLVDLTVDGARLGELGLRPARHHPPVVEDDHLVRERDRRQAMGDDQRRPSLHRLAEAEPDPRLRRRVHRGCGVVEDEDARAHRNARGRWRCAGAARPRA